jgi:hypothetical protein
MELFRTELESYLKQAEDKAKVAANRVGEGFFSTNTNEELIDNLISQCAIVPIQLDDHPEGQDNQSAEVVEHFGSERRTRPGVSIWVRYRFVGQAQLWNVQPLPFTTAPVHGDVEQLSGSDIGFLTIYATLPTVTEDERFKLHLDGQIDLIRRNLAQQRINFGMFNEDRLAPLIRRVIEGRRLQIDKRASVQRLLNIPLIPRAGVPQPPTSLITRRMIRPLKEPAIAGDPFIRDEDYGHILSVIRHEGRTFEATLATMAKLGEVDLRNLILAHLNGHYQGQATAEAFRAHGKTDIRIESENRAAFVAECKVWDGEKKLGEAIEQLLGYLTWRDCKTSLIVFNKDNAGFAALQDKMAGLLKCRPNWVKEKRCDEPGEWRHVFRSRHDADRFVTTHVFLFDLFFVQ